MVVGHLPTCQLYGQVVASDSYRVGDDSPKTSLLLPTTPFLDSFRVADKPLVSPLPKEIAAFLLDCR
jgi:hypothetical protein